MGIFIINIKFDFREDTYCLIVQISLVSHKEDEKKNIDYESLVRSVNKRHEGVFDRIVSFLS